jgi:hypothetical protein
MSVPVLYADYDHDSEHEYEHDGVALDDIQDEEDSLRSQLGKNAQRRTMAS